MSTVLNLFIVGAIIVLGLIAQYLFRKIKLPDVLILMGFGVFLSSFGVMDSLKTNTPAITFLIIFSLIYVVFYGALPIRLQALFSTMKYAFASSVLNFTLITALIGVVAYLLFYSWILAFSLGALFCVLDGSIINSFLGNIRLSRKAEAQIQTESAIIDILVIVGILSIMNFSDKTFTEVLQGLSNYLFLSFGIGLIVAILWAFALQRVRNYGSAPVATMALLVMLYAFAEYVNANGVITVFSFSLIMGNVTLWSKLLYKKQKDNVQMMSFATKSFFRDVSFLIRTFLFVYLGFLVDLQYWPYLLVGFAFFIVAYLVRELIAQFVRNKDLTDRENHYMEAMCAKGLTPTVMLAVIQADPIFSNIIIGGIFFSVIVTSLFVFLISKGRYANFYKLTRRRRHAF